MKTKYFCFFVAIAFIAIAMSCNNENGEPTPPTPPTPIDPIDENPTEVINLPEITVSNGAIELTREEKDVSMGFQKFGVDLFRHLQRENTTSGNLVISPISAGLALSLAANGAEGETYTQIATTLGFSNMSLADVNNYNYKLTEGLTQLDSEVTLSFANAAFTNIADILFPNYIQRLNLYYSGEFFNIENGVSDINRWIGTKTNGKITNLLTEEEGNSLLYLVNALYMKAPWVSPFIEEANREGVFYNADGTESMVTFMRKAETVGRYTENEIFQSLSIDLGTKNKEQSSFNFIILKPKENNRVEQVADWLCNNNLGDIVTVPIDYNVIMELRLPKFKVDNNIFIDEGLKKCGILQAFEKDIAEFPHISPYFDMFISKVKQGASFEINEGGIEGAATTAVMIDGSAGPATREMTLDRPFMFVVTERHSNAIIFIGEINKL